MVSSCGLEISSGLGKLDFVAGVFGAAWAVDAGEALVAGFPLATLSGLAAEDMARRK